jgi:hypothetical protein
LAIQDELFEQNNSRTKTSQTLPTQTPLLIKPFHLIKKKLPKSLLKFRFLELYKYKDKFKNINS